MKVNKTASLLCALAYFALSATPAMADSAKDIQTLAKAIGFIDGGPSGPVEINILYEPGNAVSSSHADEIVGLLSGGVNGGKVTLTGKKVTSANAATSKIIFVTKGISGMYSAALNKAAANGGLTVSTDTDCLGGGCVLVVKTEPNVDIFVSTEAAGKTGTEFASAFSMMITKK